MTRLVLGVIGHVDHGKTALVRALTGQDTDRLPEEKQRGISIALGFAHLQIDTHTDIDLIDMPGHEHFVRTMIAGATGIDAVLLVLAANEGIKPQTIEHIDIAALLGLRRAVVAISKIDLVTAEQARMVADAAVQLLTRAGLQPLPPVQTSVIAGTGIDELRQTLTTLATEQHLEQPLGQQSRVDAGLTFLPIDRAFSIAGHGPVITGTLRGAGVSVGDTLELLPARRPVRVRAVQVHGKQVAHAIPGQRVALNLRDVEVSELQRGMVLAASDTLTLSDWLTIAIRAVPGAPALKNGMRLRALLGTDEVDIRLRLLDREVLEPGEHGFAQLHCARPLAIPAGEHVVLRIASPPQTVAGGKLLEVVTRRQKRHQPKLLERLHDLQVLPPTEMIIAEVNRNALAGTTLQQLSQLSSLNTTHISELLQSHAVMVTRNGVVIRQSDLQLLLGRITALLAPQANGLAHERLLAALPDTSAAVLDVALTQLQANKAIIERNQHYMIPRPDEDRARALNELELAGQIATLLQREGLTPPNPGTIVIDAPSKRAVDRLLREGIVVRAVDRAKGKEILFHRDAIKTAKQRLSPLLAEPPGLLVTEIAATLGISRKYAMPLLDHLDKIRFTRRIDDRRMLA